MYSAQNDLSIHRPKALPQLLRDGISLFGKRPYRIIRIQSPATPRRLTTRPGNSSHSAHHLSSLTMERRIALTVRDNELLQALSLRLRCLSVVQIAAHWWATNSDAIGNARRRLRLLEVCGFLTIQSVLARELPHLEAPVLTWSPGDATPDFAPIAYHLKKRFVNPVTATPIAVVTRSAASRFGGHAGRVPRPSEASHDLGLGSVYLSLLRKHPARARCWIPEASLVAGRAAIHRKVPDALIRPRRGPEVIIEFGGEYSKAKLEEFHDECCSRRRGYELW